IKHRKSRFGNKQIQSIKKAAAEAIKKESFFEERKISMLRSIKNKQPSSKSALYKTVSPELKIAIGAVAFYTIEIETLK
ncbi:MAG: hypothetical protein ACTTKC_05850, partial [Treponema sp.]|uniref:hypothetical protein n=1 Tax=Treponema sp. TaxID=166 RepID=UPI003FA25274